MNEKLQAICGHSGEFTYDKKEVYSYNIKFCEATEDRGPTLITNMPYTPSIYTYQKTCDNCGESVEIEREEYNEHLKAIELASIESDRESLEARQRKVMGA
jgi:rRNA maturation protein Nop10